MGYFKILSLDGGGIRGLLTCKLLERVEMESPGFLDKVDLFAGTSTGGILALGLAAGLTPSEMGDIYEKQGGSIFHKTLWDKFYDIDRFWQADYGNRPLMDALKDKFGDLKLGDLKKKVLISSFRLDSGKVSKVGVRSWKPKFFQNYGDDPEDCDQEVVDVALYTSAAPTYFPLHHGYADGGVVANNPSMCALAQALDKNNFRQLLHNIALLSIGTGLTPKWVEGFDDNWGFKQWAPHLISIMMDGVSGVADYQCKQLLGQRYLRLNAVFQREVALDSIGEIPYLIELAGKEDFKDARNWIKKYFRDTVKPTHN